MPRKEGVVARIELQAQKCAIAPLTCVGHERRGQIRNRAIFVGKTRFRRRLPCVEYKAGGNITRPASMPGERQRQVVVFDLLQELIAVEVVNETLGERSQSQLKIQVR